MVAFHEAETYMAALPEEQRSSMDSRIELQAARLANEEAQPEFAQQLQGSK